MLALASGAPRLNALRSYPPAATPRQSACYARRVPGTLYVVATPLGNLDDLSPRALGILRQVTCIACEDTRRTSRLLSRFEIRTPTVSCHKFNERSRLEAITRRLQDGENVALVSDGGTPAISDPGARLVAEVLDRGWTVSPIPGASAVATLLSASGLTADRYVFDGFLPHRAGERRRRLRELASESRTVVVFESPHRILDTLEDLEAILGERTIVLGREITKVHETILRGTAARIRERIGTGAVRGEITLALEGADPSSAPLGIATDDARIVTCWREERDRHPGDRRRALRAAATRIGMKRAELSRRLAELGEGE